jgi:hypothetical protein
MSRSLKQLTASEISVEQINAAITEHVSLVKSVALGILAEGAPSYIDESDLHSVGHEELVRGVQAQLRNSGTIKPRWLRKRIRTAMIRYLRAERGDPRRSIPIDPPPYPGDDASRLTRLAWCKDANGLGKQDKVIYRAARVRRTSFWKWKTDLLPDSSEISQRIERVLQRGDFAAGGLPHVNILWLRSRKPIFLNL